MKITSIYGSDARGSVASTTASRNRGGLYLKARTAPTNPRTAKQIQLRNATAQIAALWKTLTAAQLAGWRLYAASLNTQNKLGSSISISGINAFIGFNSPIVYGLGIGNIQLNPPGPGPHDCQHH